jgi:pyruvate formate lyase activating enzyme
VREAVLYKKLPRKLVRCTACNWYCTIAPGQVGVCATRLNRDGRLYSLVYGHAIGLHLDPVEKKPLFHFLPGSRVLSFGTVGCNFACAFCQNWEMSQASKEVNRGVRSGEEREEKLLAVIRKMSTPASPREIVEQASREGAAGIAYTYNEPAIFVEYAHDTAALARRRGLKNVYVSNGFESAEAFDYMKDLLDAINVDLKSFRPEFYRELSRAKVEPVKENIKKFFASGIVTEVTTLVIPGENDSAEELRQIARFLAGISTNLPWHISAFYPAYRMSNLPPTPPETLERAYEIGKRAGLKYVYVGNIPDSKHTATYCPRCGVCLVWREGYVVTVEKLDSRRGRCRNCGEKIYGYWSESQA